MLLPGSVCCVNDRTKAFIELMLTAADEDVVTAIGTVTADPDTRDLLNVLSATARVFLQISFRSVPGIEMEKIRDLVVAGIVGDDDEVLVEGRLEVAPRPPYPAEAAGAERTRRLLAVLS